MFTDPPIIDLAILTRTAGDLHPQVEAAVLAQTNVVLRIHRIVGTPHELDRNRVDTIVRARNEAVCRADGEWLMFLDDDVVLAPDCIARLHHALMCRPNFGAFAADYLGDCGHSRPSPHIAMGATLFRTEFLPAEPFRSEIDKCECLCRCLDMRQAGLRIEYLPGAHATHDSKLVSSPSENERQSNAANRAAAERELSPVVPAQGAKILVAFDRRDVKYFRDVFLDSLRANGNHQQVIVVGYGLRPSEVRRLNAQPNVNVVSRSYNGQMAPVRRLRDFGDIVTGLPAQTPVAYWDASDVIFQGHLEPLWKLTAEHPDKLLAVREPVGYPENPAASAWCSSITDTQKRSQAFDLIASNPFLNSGFGAGTASSLAKYFRTADRIRCSSDLRGTTDWGDQMAMNLYCHQDSSRWQEVSDTWNFCMMDRPRGAANISSAGIISCRSGRPICAVHGNGKSLRQLAIRPH